jgi:hypothetical protein
MCPLRFPLLRWQIFFVRHSTATVHFCHLLLFLPFGQYLRRLLLRDAFAGRS